MTTFSRSQICSNKSAWEHELADLLCVINVSGASIPASTSAVLPRKKDLSAGLMLSNTACWLTFFSIDASTSKLDLSRASTVWLLQSRWWGWCFDPRDNGIDSSIFNFFVTLSVINASILSHRPDGGMRTFSKIVIAARLNVSTNSSVIWSRSSYAKKTWILLH